MKKKHIQLFAFIAIFILSTVLYLQYGRELDASGSYYYSDTLAFNVTLNQLWFNSSTQKNTETAIIQKFNDNTFHSTQFSTDLIQPKHLRISVYLNKNAIIYNDPIFIFSKDL